jgi:putative ABC transport system permease protein
MTLHDLIEISLSNLWRSKLRSFLTISGVVIAIAAFVSMLSFGAGNQKYITDIYVNFGLFTSMHVFPLDEDENDDSDTIQTIPLNNATMKQLTEIPGVNLVYPYDAFEVTAYFADSQFSTQVRSLPIAATKIKLFAGILNGQTFSSDTANEVFVTHEFLEKVGISEPDSVIGRELIICARAASLDSALVNIFDNKDRSLRQRLESIEFDSLFRSGYRKRIMQQELNEGVRRFVEGFTNRQLLAYDTLTIKGVAKELRSHHINVAPIIIPEKKAAKLSAGGFGMGSNPIDLYNAAKSGMLFNAEGSEESQTYTRLTLNLDPYASHEKIKDSVEALGFRVFSFAEQFKEIQRFFLYYNLGLAIIGLIALATAALGIINTMVMSIVERRKEIGVIISLGADVRDIKILFLAESAVIGAIGAAIGIICGWAASRIVSAVMQVIMEREGIPAFDPFALPIWLILLSLAFGITVSLLAGYYPASRAAKVDPVEALRSE